jgi:hypothetical protein
LKTIFNISETQEWQQQKSANRRQCKGFHRVDTHGTERNWRGVLRNSLH